MPATRKCPKCGHELTDAAAKLCPLCGTSFRVPQKSGVWVGALVQFVLAAAFLLIFHFPKWIILLFGVLMLAVTALSLKFNAAAASAQRTPPQKATRPVLARILGVAIALCSFAFLCIALFGLVIFLNAWDRWHRYEGQPYHPAVFEVRQVYYQRGNRGSVDVYARGSVEDRQEWMSLQPYLHGLPHDQSELEERVPAGTSIPVYLFPEMRGRQRVQIIGDAPPAEASRRQAKDTAKYGGGGLAVVGVLIWLLVRWQRRCYEKDPALATTASL